MTSTPDRIEKTVILKASRSRVWRAISDSAAFGAWFGVKLDGPFEAGKAIVGHIVPTEVDPEVAKMQEPYRGAKFEITIETVIPEREFSFRWHPFAIDPNHDYSAEPTTLVVFRLSDPPRGEEGVLLTITESGFDRVPLERRAKAFTANEGGWAAQAKLIEKYLAMHAKSE